MRPVGRVHENGQRAWIAANEGETDPMGAVSQSKDHDAKHDKTMPSLLLQLDGVESKVRDEMSARLDRDHRDASCQWSGLPWRQGLSRE